MDAQAVVAYNVRKHRLALGLTQEAFADDADVDRSYIGRLERGTENPSVAVLAKIATALQVDIAALFTPPAADEPPPVQLKKGPKGKGL